MIIAFRKKLKGPLATVLAMFVAFIIGMWGFENYLTKTQSQQVVEVGKITLEQNEINKLYQSYIRVLKPEQLNDTEYLLHLKKTIIQTMAERKAYKNYFDIEGYQLSPYLVLAVLSNQLGFDTSKGLNEVQAWIKTSRNESRSNIAQTKEQLVSQMVFSSLYLSTPNDLLNQQLMHFRNNHKRYIQFKKISPLTSNYNPSASSIKSYYDLHTKQFMSPEAINLKYIHIPTPHIPSPTEKEITAYYEKNEHVFRQPSTELQHQVVIKYTLNGVKTTSKADLDKVRKEFINFDNANTFESFIKGRAVSITFHDETIALNKSSKIKNKDEIETSTRKKDQLKITKTAEVTYSTPKLSSIKPKVIEHFIKDKTNQAAIVLNEKINDLSFTSPDSLASIKDYTKQPILTKNSIQKGMPLLGLFNQSAITKEIFSNDVYNNKFNSQSILLADQSIIVLRVDHKSKSHPMPLTKVQNKIKHILINQELKKQANIILHSFNNADKPSRVKRTLSYQKPTNDLKPVWSQLWEMRIGEIKVLSDNGTYYIVKVDGMSLINSKTDNKANNTDVSELSLSLYQQSILSDYIKVS
jgi:peptidyl-prolyl cis-trans isomerase D